MRLDSPVRRVGLYDSGCGRYDRLAVVMVCVLCICVSIGT